MADTKIGSRSAGARPRIVILGGGFGGLACAARLRDAPVDVTLVDRRNHNLFQPLLYQVATAALAEADIAEPIRSTLAPNSNIWTMLADVTGIDVSAQRVATSRGPVGYDRLVIATGSDYDYFGHPEWAERAPGLKTLSDARAIRERLLTAYETAEFERDPRRRARLMTTVVIGGGPTGVELAGAVAELGHSVAGRDYHHIDRAGIRVVLVEAGPAVLPAFGDGIPAYARRRLEELGVEVRTGTPVESIDRRGVVVSGETIEAETVVWAAGVKATPVASWLGVESDRKGRVEVDERLALPGRPEIHVIGDAALARDRQGNPLPALGQVARQQGDYVGRLLRRELLEGRESKPFRFGDRGSTAIIGRGAAVYEFGRWRMTGRLAWLFWALVHIYLLTNFEKRVLVSTQWLWRVATGRRGARLIETAEPKSPRRPDGTGPSPARSATPRRKPSGPDGARPNAGSLPRSAP